MNVIPLPVVRRGIGVTASDRQCTARFLFSRPGWEVADQFDARLGRCLELSFARPDGQPPLTWRLIRSQACIFVEGADATRHAGPYASTHEALLMIWEDAERRSADPQPKPLLGLCGIDPLLADEFQDIAAIAGFETLLVPDGAMDAAVAAGLPLAAAVVELQLHPSGADGRDVIRLLRRTRPSLPVLVLTVHPPTAPEADLHGLGGPTHREKRPHDADRVLHWLLGVYEALGDEALGDDPA